MISKAGKSYNPFSKTKVEIENFDLISEAKSLRNLTALVFESAALSKTSSSTTRTNGNFLQRKIFSKNPKDLKKKAIMGHRLFIKNGGGNDTLKEATKINSKKENGILGGNGPIEETSESVSSRRVYVKNIPFSLKEGELQEKVETSIGRIELCYICKKKRRANSKTDYGFITFASQELAEKALGMRKLKFKKYKTKLVFKQFIFKKEPVVEVKESVREFGGQIKLDDDAQVTQNDLSKDDKPAVLGRKMSIEEPLDHNLNAVGSIRASIVQISKKKNNKKRCVVPPDFDLKGDRCRQSFRFHSRLLARVKKNHVLGKNLRLNRLWR